MLSRGHKLATGKPWVIPERAILASCKHLLRLYENMGLLVFRRIGTTGTVRSRFGKQILTKNPDGAGVPDLFIWVKNGPLLTVELKSETGTLELSQRELREKLRKVGHDFDVVRSVDELEDLLVSHGLPRLTLVRSVASNNFNGGK